MEADLKVAPTHTNGIQLSPKCVCVRSVCRWVECLCFVFLDGYFNPLRNPCVCDCWVMMRA